MKDWLGVCFSGLCIVHCILTPLLLAISGTSLVGAWFGADWVHYVLLAPVSVALLWSLPPSFAKHRNIKPLLYSALGFSLLLTSLALPQSAEQWLAIGGGIALIAAHLMNRFLLRQYTSATTSG
jgi:hypothetical protein